MKCPLGRCDTFSSLIKQSEFNFRMALMTSIQKVVKEHHL